MTWKDYNNNLTALKNKLGKLETSITEDGSLTLYNSYYDETFHSHKGALREAEQKFLIPANTKRFDLEEEINL